MSTGGAAPAIWRRETALLGQAGIDDLVSSSEDMLNAHGGADRTVAVLFAFTVEMEGPIADLDGAVLPAQFPDLIGCTMRPGNMPSWLQGPLCAEAEGPPPAMVLYGLPLDGPSSTFQLAEPSMPDLGSGEAIKAYLQAHPNTLLLTHPDFAFATAAAEGEDAMTGPSAKEAVIGLISNLFPMGQVASGVASHASLVSRPRQQSRTSEEQEGQGGPPLRSATRADLSLSRSLSAPTWLLSSSRGGGGGEGGGGGDGGGGDGSTDSSELHTLQVHKEGAVGAILPQSYDLFGVIPTIFGNSEARFQADAATESRLFAGGQKEKAEEDKMMLKPLAGTAAAGTAAAGEMGADGSNARTSGDNDEGAEGVEGVEGVEEEEEESGEGMMMIAGDGSHMSSLPLFCLRDTFLFPRDSMPFNVFEPRYRLMLRQHLETGKPFGIVAPAPEVGDPLMMVPGDEFDGGAAVDGVEVAEQQQQQQQQGDDGGSGSEKERAALERAGRAARARAPMDPFEGLGDGGKPRGVVGTTARVTNVVQMEEDGRCVVIVQGGQRFDLREGTVRMQEDGFGLVEADIDIIHDDEHGPGDHLSTSPESAAEGAGSTAAKRLAMKTCLSTVASQLEELEGVAARHNHQALVGEINRIRKMHVPAAAAAVTKETAEGNTALDRHAEVFSFEVAGLLSKVVQVRR